MADFLVQREIGRVRAAAATLAKKYDSAGPAQKDAVAQNAAARLVRISIGGAAAIRAAQDADPFVALIGLMGIARRPTLGLAADSTAKLADWLVSYLSQCQPELEPLVYQTLLRHAAQPLIGSVLAKIDETVERPALAEFIRNRMQLGEQVTSATFEGRVPYRNVDRIAELLLEHSGELGDDFSAAFEEWRSRVPALEQTDGTPHRATPPGVATLPEVVEAFAERWDPPFDRPAATLVRSRFGVVDRIEAALRQDRRSVLLVGPAGVGKTRLIRAALARVPERSPVFEAGAAKTYAGCIYVGELETKIEQMASVLAATPAVWVFPRLDEAISAGQHSRSPRGMLDALLPHLGQDGLTIVGEVTDEGYARILNERPGAASAFEVVRVRPTDQQETLEIARAWLRESELTASEETLIETYELSTQFIADAAPPGNFLSLLNDAADDVLEEGRCSLEGTDVLRRLAANTALPLTLLDRHTPLDLPALRAFFEQRILHQPEALDVVTQRIAMVKAGLTDPDRPLAVLFFVGPTGTGKTELAKALAEYMFGSPDRMIRVDMSEYVTADGFDRLLAGGGDGQGGASLVAAVQKDPFAVILLDEFEKANPAVWDLFLQVFDDGRLTDRRGATVDFRRTVLIMTSNAGSALASRWGIGFAADGDRFDAERVLETINKTFRPEFRNRIDSIVVFRPFGRDQLRTLLDKELAAALERRGLRTRPWAIEIDSSAYDFLIDRGFSHELGARPLRRAIERHLLGPLATAIVGQGVPEGDQFLFVRATGSRLSIVFVDPDEPPRESPNVPSSSETREPLRLSKLALSPEVSPAALRFLGDEVLRIRRAAHQLGLSARKDAALEAINASGFWERAERFATLAEAQYLDRFDAALESARRHAERLVASADSAHNRSADRRERVERLAIRLLVLDCALAGLESGSPVDLFLRLRTWGAGRQPESADADVLDVVASMYTEWAIARGMHIEELAASAEERLLAVRGLGCGRILEDEVGLHVFGPYRNDEGNAERRLSIIHVCMTEATPGPEGTKAARLAHARRAFVSATCATEPVRRYVTGPAPLVRDRVRRYRTGRINDVLAGKFDLF